MPFNGPVTLTAEQFQTLLSRIRENAPAAAPAAPAVPLTPDQQLAERMWSMDQPRPRPPFDARAVMVGMESARQENEVRRVVAAQVEAQLAAIRRA